MRALNVTTVGCLLLVSAAWWGQSKNRSIVLPESASQELAQPCSRPGPPKFEATWQLMDADVRAMESRLSRISRLSSKSGIKRARLPHPERYYRQYVGIVIHKRKFIYINAFCDQEPPSYWQTTAVDVCDGGCSWGVIYDVSKGAFSDLELNGIG